VSRERNRELEDWESARGRESKGGREEEAKIGGGRERDKKIKRRKERVEKAGKIESGKSGENWGSKERGFDGQ
jgi:hypothetical protein